jgi:hypothetical protein
MAVVFECFDSMQGPLAEKVVVRMTSSCTWCLSAIP